MQYIHIKLLTYVTIALSQSWVGLNFALQNLWKIVLLHQTQVSEYNNYCSIYQKSIVFDHWSEFSILDSSKDTPLKVRDSRKQVLPKNQRCDNFQYIKLSQRLCFGRIEDTNAFEIYFLQAFYQASQKQILKEFWKNTFLMVTWPRTLQECMLPSHNV